MSNTLLQSWRRLPENTRGYFVAAATTVVAAAFGILLRPYLDRSVFILFAAPIALTAWYGGRGPALAATFFGLTAADLIFLRQSSFYLPSEPSDVVAIGVYLVVALTIVHLSTLLRLSRAEAQDHAKALQDQAMELELQTTELEQQTHEAQILSEELEEAHEELKLRTNAQLSEAQALARLGSWEWDIVNDSITWSDEMYRLYALDPSSEPIDYQRYQSLLHPDDRDVSGEAVKHSLDTGQPFSFDHRIIRADGVERIFHARGRVVRGDDGKPLRMYGTGQDVTETRRAAAALQRAAEYAGARLQRKQLRST